MLSKVFMTRWIQFGLTLLKPFMEHALVDHLNNLDQKCIGGYHSHHESIKIGRWWYHTQSSIELGNVGHSQDKEADKRSQDDNGGRGPRLDERDFPCSKEMNNEDLMVQCSRGGQWDHCVSFSS